MAAVASGSVAVTPLRLNMSPPPAHGRRVRGALVLLCALLVFVGVAFRTGAPEATPAPASAPTIPTAAVSGVREGTAEPLVAPSPSLAGALNPLGIEHPDACLTVRAGDKVLYESRPEMAVAPASVTKILTAAAALDALGQSARLRTGVLADAPPLNGVVAGSVWLVGGGDPVLATDAWARRSSPVPLYTSLDELADRVVAAGVRRVEGAVVGDDRRYDDDRYVDTWPARLVGDGEAGPLSALSVNDGFRVWGHPGVPFTDPPAGAAGLFTELLVARGVAVVQPPSSGGAGGGVEIAGIDSPPVGDLVDAMLRGSDNGTAELLVKELGLRRFGDGSTAAGVRAMRDLLGRGGVPLEGVVIADGSGLSGAARLTCRSVTALLAARSADLAGRLPVAGRDGTLARRFLNSQVAGRLRAKTGSLNGVSALAGYADNVGGETLSFTYIINGLPGEASGRATQDAVAAALVATTP